MRKLEIMVVLSRSPEGMTNQTMATMVHQPQAAVGSITNKLWHQRLTERDEDPPSGHIRHRLNERGVRRLEWLLARDQAEAAAAQHRDDAQAMEADESDGGLDEGAVEEFADSTLGPPSLADLFPAPTRGPFPAPTPATPPAVTHSNSDPIAAALDEAMQLRRRIDALQLLGGGRGAF